MSSTSTALIAYPNVVTSPPMFLNAPLFSVFMKTTIMSVVHYLWHKLLLWQGSMPLRNMILTYFWHWLQNTFPNAQFYFYVSAANKPALVTKWCLSSFGLVFKAFYDQAPIKSSGKFLTIPLCVSFTICAILSYLSPMGHNFICWLYTYIYTHTHTYIYIYTHTYIRVYIYTYIYIILCIHNFT